MLLVFVLLFGSRYLIHLFDIMSMDVCIHNASYNYSIMPHAYSNSNTWFVNSGPPIMMLALFLTAFPPVFGYSSLITMSGKSAALLSPCL